MIILGINTSGLPHFGNYLTLIKPVLKFKKKNIFLADFHCFSKINSFKNVILGKIFLSLVFKSFFKKIIFFYQSYNKNIILLFWLISCFYNINKTKIFLTVKKFFFLSISKFCYPILMCSDIISINNKYIFLGIDQIQHIEIYSKIIYKINNFIKKKYFLSNKFIVNNKVLYSYDKRKMSKSNKNDLFFFSDYKELLIFFNKFKITLKRKKSILNFYKLILNKNINFNNSFKKNKTHVIEDIYYFFLNYKKKFINYTENLNFYFKELSINNFYFKNVINNNFSKIKYLLNL